MTRRTSSNKISGKQVHPQVGRILQNIIDCDQTPRKEKELLRSVILNGYFEPSSSIDLQEVMRQIQAMLRETVKSNGLLFRGRPLDFHKTRHAWHARHVGRFLAGVARSMRTADPIDDVTFASAREESVRICDSLRRAQRWPEIVREKGQVAMHFDSAAPFWIADAESGIPHPMEDLALLPARLGLLRDPKMGAEYFIFRLTLPTDIFSPRFSDSLGHVSWRPGGITLPDQAITNSHSGLVEAVTEVGRLKYISAEPWIVKRRI